MFNQIDQDYLDALNDMEIKMSAFESAIKDVCTAYKGQYDLADFDPIIEMLEDFRTDGLVPAIQEHKDSIESDYSDPYEEHRFGSAHYGVGA